jgi:hypothetical protein
VQDFDFAMYELGFEKTIPGGWESLLAHKRAVANALFDERNLLGPLG